MVFFDCGLVKRGQPQVVPPGLPVDVDPVRQHQTGFKTGCPAGLGLGKMRNPGKNTEGDRPSDTQVIVVFLGCEHFGHLPSVALHQIKHFELSVPAVLSKSFHADGASAWQTDDPFPQPEEAEPSGSMLNPLFPVVGIRVRQTDCSLCFTFFEGMPQRQKRWRESFFTTCP
jgi:hypothetical protein